MKKISFMTCLSALLLFMAACGNEADGNVVPDGDTIDITATFAAEAEARLASVIDLDADGQTRVAVTEDNAPQFNWRDGETIPLHILFRRSATSNEYATTTATLTVQSDRTAKFSAKLPAGYAAGTALIAAVSGKQPGVDNGAWASGWGSSGITQGAIIQSATTINMANVIAPNSQTQYNIPLFFALTPIPANGHVDVTFRMYGNLVGLKMTNNTTAAITPKSVTVNTGKFSSGGFMKLHLSDFGPAGWTSDGLTTNTFNITNLQIPAGETRMPWIWVKQGTSTDTSVKLTYADDANGSSTFDKTIAPAFENGQAYRLTMDIEKPQGELIISEFYQSTSIDGAFNWIEFYNPTDHSVSTQGYYLVNSRGESRPLSTAGTIAPREGFLFGTNSAAADVSGWSKWYRFSSDTRVLNVTQGDILYLTYGGTDIGSNLVEQFVIQSNDRTHIRQAQYNTPERVFNSSHWDVRLLTQHTLGSR